MDGRLDSRTWRWITTTALGYDLLPLHGRPGSILRWLGSPTLLRTRSVYKLTLPFWVGFPVCTR